MLWCGCKLLIFFLCLINFSSGTIDINFNEYQYLADHLTEKECHDLVSALHFHSFELPKELIAAERRLPGGVPCIELLLHWNSAPREGKGQTHVEVCHRLNQIGREDLAQWLSKTVFHEISKDLKVALTAETEETTSCPMNITEEPCTEGNQDESAWWIMDSILEAIVVCGLITLFFGSIYFCILFCKRKMRRSRGYHRLCSEFN